MKTNQEYKNLSLDALKGRWKMPVLTTLVYFGLAILLEVGQDESLFGPVFIGAFGLVSVFLFANIGVGYYNAMKKFYLEKELHVSDMFRLGFNNYLHILGGILLVFVKVFLWTLLLIVPGIIKAISYSMTQFILVDRPELSASEAIDLSKKMMDGHKMDFFLLTISFIGWLILGVFTLGIAYLWILPYMYCAIAAFYEDLKSECQEQ